MLSCLVAVLAMFLAIISPSSYSWKEWNVRHFCFHNQNNSTIVPRSYRLAESVSGQDEANPAFLLATRALEISHVGPTCKSFLFGDILYWTSHGWILASFFFLRVYWPRLRLGQKKRKKKRECKAETILYYCYLYQCCFIRLLIPCGHARQSDFWIPGALL